MKFKVIIILIQFHYLSLLVINCISIDLIKNFVKEKHLKDCVYLSCEKFSENTKILKALHNYNISTGFYNNNVSFGISSASIEKLLKFRNYQIGVVHDLDCQKTENYLKKISTSSMFGLRYSWLMFTTNFSKAEMILENENINVDSDITLALITRDGLVVLNFFLFAL